MTDELATRNLRLRRWGPQDLEPLARIFSIPEVWRYPFGRGLTLEETEGFLAMQIAAHSTGGWAEWAVELRSSGALIGYIGLAEPHFLPEVMPTVEVGWRLDPAVWGRGLATEGARAVLAHGFSNPTLQEVVSIYQPENAASGRVMARLGMRFDRVTTHPTRGVTVHVYKLTRRQWERQSIASTQ